MKTLIIVLAAGTGILGYCQSSDLENKMKVFKVDIDFEGDIAKFCEWLADTMDATVIADPRMIRQVGDSIKIKLKMKKVAVSTVLKIVCAENNLAYTTKDDILTISTRKLAAQYRTEFIDVRDITMKIRNFKGPDFSLKGSEEGGIIDDFGAPEVENAFSDIGALIDLVKGYTGGKSWEEDDQVSITSIGDGILVVKQTREVLRDIMELLNKLRAMR